MTDFWRKIFAAIPRWARYTIKAFFAYAVINFALLLFLSKGGVRDVRDGKYVLHNHGQVIRELSEDEYEWQKAYLLRGFSGHWLVFYLVAAFSGIEANRLILNRSIRAGTTIKEMILRSLVPIDQDCSTTP